MMHITSYMSILKEKEPWLMERILSYAKEQGYTQYTSTLVEAWRVSIAGLSDAILETYAVYGDVLPGFSPEERFEDDPVTQFGVTEARLHRERGISLSMFLGLYKYYRYTFVDLVRELLLAPDDAALCQSFVERCFDRIEIAFCTQWAGLASDHAVAELQNANRIMTNEKNKYLTLFESLDTPSFLVDEMGMLENVNPPGAALLGQPQVQGAMYYADGRSDDAPHASLAGLLPWLKDPLDALLKKENLSFRVELETRGEKGPRYFIGMFSRMRDVSGKFRGGVVLLEDVTERKEMERLKEDVATITRHDLKVPLGGILGVFNWLLDNETLGNEQRSMLGMARESGYAMLDMINRSLDILKMERGAYCFEPQAVDLGVVLRRVVEHAGKANPRGIAVRVIVDGVAHETAFSCPRLQAEEMLLYTALGNLLTNAIEASPQGGEVVVEVAVAEACRIRIVNQGGVPWQIRDTFFEKYATWGKKNGTGLGTYSAKLIVETMGGRVSMTSDDHTTEVVLDMPLAE